MQSSIEYQILAVELRERVAYAWLQSTRRRLSRRADDLERAARSAENVERLQRIAAWEALRAEASAPARGAEVA